MIKIVALSALMLSVLACPGSDQRCSGCMGTMCQVCYDSYVSANGRCVQSSVEIENCLEYFADGICKYCQHGYYVNSQGTCTKISLDHCAEVDVNNLNRCI